MVSLASWMLVAILIGCAEPVGVIRVSRGEVSWFEASQASVPPSSGALLCETNGVAVGVGWAELLVGKHGRIRLSSQTELQVSGIDRIRLLRGRVWLETGLRAPVYSVLMKDYSMMIHPGSSVVIEHAHGGIITVVRGEVQLSSEHPRIKAGQTGLVDGSEPVKRGGYELYALVRRETRAGLGDIAGWKAFLLNGINDLDIGTRPHLTNESLVEAHSIPPAGEGADRMVEEALRPPPIRLQENK
ncbi:MAG: hypothetical protein KTR25_04465 [Myxococcales bacterium]|nr:hypothetical protein [Myxococcales bacterium]